MPSGKKKSTKLESLSDLERALSESKDTASAVCDSFFFFEMQFLGSSLNVCICLTCRSVAFHSFLLVLLFSEDCAEVSPFQVSKVS